MENAIRPAGWSKKNRAKGFSIIEFLLVLTAFVIFLGAAFIGYRTLKANGNETQIANRFKLFATGLKNYAKDFYNSYPYVSCSTASDWTSGTAPSNNVASCAALEQYIGSFVLDGWSYTGYTYTGGTTTTPPSGGKSASSNNGANSGVSITNGYYTFTTEPIDNGYVQAILNQANAYGLYCGTSAATNNTGSSLISCTSGNVLVSGSNSANYF